MKKIIIVKPKTLSSKDKEKLTKNGNVVIEHPIPSEVLFKDVADGVVYEFVNCANCGDRIYVTKDRMQAIRQNGNSFCCSRGHYQSFSKKST